MVVVAVRAADSGETLVQIAALQEGRHGALDDRPPETILGLKSLVVDLLEGGEMPVQQAPQVGCLRIAWAVEGQRLDKTPKIFPAAQGGCHFWARRVQSDERVFKNRDSRDGPWPHAVTLPELRCACSRPTK
jgi:hypothetical protein